MAKRDAVGDPEDVGIDRDPRIAERHIDHDVRGLAADARQRFQNFDAVRHLAAEILDQPSAPGR